jgi:hypothetical protein
MRFYEKGPLFILLASLGCITPSQGGSEISRTIETVPCSECFPIEKLPARLQNKAAAGLLALLDSEALYTIVGGIKPITAEFFDFIFPQSSKYTQSDYEDFQMIVQSWQCTPLLKAALFRHTQKTKKGMVVGSVVIARSDLVSKTIHQRKEIYSKFQIQSDSPIETIFKILAPIGFSSRKDEAQVAYGYLFGYPEYAIQYFAGRANSSEKNISSDFITIPTHETIDTPFNWAVPKGHQKNTEDLAIENKALPIFKTYEGLRRRYLTTFPETSVKIIRDWFNNGSGQCSPLIAETKD